MRYYHAVNIGNHTFTFTFQLGEKVDMLKFFHAKKPDKKTEGLTSRCSDAKHIVTLDFDGQPLFEVLEEIEFLILEFKLSNFYIFKNDRENSFHAICLDKFNLWEAVEIVSRTSADKAHKKAPYLFRQKRWVLRVAPKGERKRPTYLKTVKSKFNEYATSQAHRKFLEIHYDIKIKKLKYEDDFEDFLDSMTGYNTGANC